MRAVAVASNNHGNDEVVAVLVRLLGLCRDGVHGYGHAARLTNEPNLRELFSQLHTQREACALELEDVLWNLGMRATGAGSVIGALHSPWIEARARMAHGSRGVLEECARGDAEAIHAYRVAIESLPDGAASRVVGEHFATICGAREKVMKALAELPG